jgi:hypothetical protein
MSVASVCGPSASNWTDGPHCSHCGCITRVHPTLGASCPTCEELTAPVSRSRLMSDVVAVEVSFLWHPYIPIGKLTLIEGDPGQGKSTITLALASSGSLGSGLPGVAPFDPWDTLIFTAEDGLADTIKPRLEAMGADCTRIRAHPEAIDLSTPEGMAEVGREIAAHYPRLVVIDPVVAYVGGRTDLYRANEVRSILSPLASMAEQHGCAIAAVRHLSKAKGGRSIYAGMGSIDFTAAARSVLLVGSSPSDPNERAMVHIKHNLTAQGPALGFSIRDGRFGWTGESTLTAGDVLGAESSNSDRSAGEEAAAFLLELLAHGPVDAKQVKADAKAAGISLRTLERIKSREGIVAVRKGFGADGAWWWTLKDRQVSS